MLFAIIIPIIYISLYTKYFKNSKLIPDVDIDVDLLIHIHAYFWSLKFELIRYKTDLGGTHVPYIPENDASYKISFDK